MSVEALKLNKKLIRIAVVEHNTEFNAALSRYLRLHFNSVSFPLFWFDFRSFESAEELYKCKDMNFHIAIVDNQNMNTREADNLKQWNKKHPSCKLVSMNSLIAVEAILVMENVQQTLQRIIDHALEKHFRRRAS